MPVGTPIKLRRDTAANWTSTNPVLQLGESGIETDTRKWKVGDGVTAWTSLLYMAGSVGAFTDLTDVPSDYTGWAGYFVAVNDAEDALEFVPTPSSVYAGTATLASGSATVAATWVTANSVIVVTPQTDGASARQLFVDPANIVPGTSFDISSSDGSDTRTVFWIATEPNPAAIINPVMRVNTTGAADGFVQHDFGSAQAEVWFSFGLAFDSATVSNWIADAGGFSGSFAFCGSGTGSTYLTEIFEKVEAGPIPNWWLFGFINDDEEVGPPAPTPDAWQDCELHISVATDTTIEFYSGGTLVATVLDTGRTASVKRFRMGQMGTAADGFVYFKDFKAGTTRGASDLFADDFSSNDLSAWDSTTGACSIVSDPF